jgi:hypothetical protein
MALSKSTDHGLEEIARPHAERAIEVLAEIMDNEIHEPRDRIRAASDLLDRGYGKPSQALIVAPSGGKLRQLAAAKTDAELVAIIEGKALPRLSPAQPLTTIDPNVQLEPARRPEYESRQDLLSGDPLSGDPASADDFDSELPLHPLLR